jgi:hypothetical protein
MKALTAVVLSAPNFKVRINAAEALAVPQSRAFFGPFPHLKQLVETLVHSLATINAMDDFKEFQYQASLQAQLVGTLMHVFGVATMQEQGQLLQTLHQQCSAAVTAPQATDVNETDPEAADRKDKDRAEDGGGGDGGAASTGSNVPPMPGNTSARSDDVEDAATALLVKLIPTISTELYEGLLLLGHPGKSAGMHEWLEACRAEKLPGQQHCVKAPRVYTHAE